METINFYQKIQTSFEEKVKMYMKLTKKQLAEMMAMRDQIEEESVQLPSDCSKTHKYCRTWTDCTNIYKDCINCPLKFNTGDTFSITTL